MKIWTKGIMIGLVSGVVLLGSLPAGAEPYPPYYYQRQINQEHRIYQGFHSGQLTPGEFRRLEHQQARINRTEARMMADGHLDRHERAQLNRMENRANRDIYRYRHNDFRPVNHRPGWR